MRVAWRGVVSGKLAEGRGCGGEGCDDANKVLRGSWMLGIGGRSVMNSEMSGGKGRDGGREEGDKR